MARNCSREIAAPVGRVVAVPLNALFPGGSQPTSHLIALICYNQLFWFLLQICPLGNNGV